jgi:hypothetical protein
VNSEEPAAIFALFLLFGIVQLAVDFVLIHPIVMNIGLIVYGEEPAEGRPLVAALARSTLRRIECKSH